MLVKTNKVCEIEAQRMKDFFFINSRKTLANPINSRVSSLGLESQFPGLALYLGFFDIDLVLNFETTLILRLESCFLM